MTKIEKTIADLEAMIAKKPTPLLKMLLSQAKAGVLVAPKRMI